MGSREKLERLGRILASVGLLGIGIASGTVASPISTALAQSTSTQYSDVEGCLSCLMWVAPLIVAVIVAVSARNRTRNAPEYMQKLSTELLRPGLEAIVSEVMPRKSWVSSSFGWKRGQSTEYILTLSRSYFSSEQGCLLYLFTGILPGLFIVWLMGRTEKVTIDMSALDTGQQIMVKGQGIRGREAAERLVGKLIAVQKASPIPSQNTLFRKISTEIPAVLN
jgi:hypothetical protein